MPHTYVPYLRTQKEIENQIRTLMRDTSSLPRWTSTEIYEAINQSLSDWSTRVQVPRYYTFSVVSGTFEYTLPDYITGPFDVQAKRTIWGVDTAELDDAWEEIWEDVPGYVVEPNATGGMSLRMESIPASVDGRIIWYGHNTQLPLLVPTLNANITSSVTSLDLVEENILIDRTGYIKVGDEWMLYSGTANDGTTITLQNLVRGIFGSTAASHTAGDDVEFGVAVFRNDLWAQLNNQVASYLHRMFINAADPAEREKHERMTSYYDKRVMDYWKHFVPLRSPKMRLSRRGIGVRTNDSSLDYRFYGFRS